MTSLQTELGSDHRKEDALDIITLSSPRYKVEGGARATHTLSSKQSHLPASPLCPRVPAASQFLRLIVFKLVP